eukprot:CAMPEP_0203978424 /NCGR_PEP_ID=MMETSP0359-20131031/102110_1 /ASSEMBLY_ACC=CAM_ASM_000338 /TAXON_ID=268821 /ORGANISM="Scrippsiella Hangoei, Strain SHTV-5" /LENGTH=1051 /DNA_ID=CAMNT_0050916635 /DNA_START=126 /DNA_END=3279 /DNA_ORIENTATION=-
MALFNAASLFTSALAEAASLVWMELAMFGLAAMCYSFFIGIPGSGAAKPTVRKGKGKVLSSDACKAMPHESLPTTNAGASSDVLGIWERAKSLGEVPPLDLASVADAMRELGKSPSDIVDELRSALTKSPAVLPSIFSLLGAFLRDDRVDMLDVTLALLEEHGHVADVSMYAGLMAAQLRRRNYVGVAATGARVPSNTLTPRMRAILASAAAQRSCLEEALGHLQEMSVPAEGAKSPLAPTVAVQILALAAKEKCVPVAGEELQRLCVRLEDKQFQELLMAEGRRSSTEVCEELLSVGSALGVPLEFARAALAKAQSAKLVAGGAGGAGGASSGELQRYASMIKTHTKERDLKSAAAVFERLCNSGTTLTPLIYNCFLDACVQCGDFECASAHFEEMKRLNVVDTVGYNTLLKAYLTRGQTVEAGNLVKEMTARGLSANKVTYNELLHAKVMSKDRRGMWSVVEEMQQAGVKPNSVTCSIILKSLTGYSQPSDLRRVIELIDNIEECIDEVLFSSVIEACIRIKEMDLLSELMKRYRQRAGFVKLSAPTYGSMIKAYGQAGDVHRVQELWAEMQEKGVKPTSITLGCLTEALVVNNKAQEAWDLVRQQMEDEERRGCINTVIPTSITLGCLAEALVVNSKAQEAWDLVRQQMEDEERRGCINTVIYSTVLKGFAVMKCVEKVFQVYREMQASGIPCNTITYNTMLDACAKSYTMSRASKLLEDMAETCVEPDIITYSTIIKGYCVEGDVDRAFHVLAEMKKDGKFQPDEIMYNSILDGCAKQHRVDEALKVLDEMKTSGIAASNYTLSILVKVLGHARRLPQAFEMVESLSSQNGFRPNVQVYTCLVQACVHNRQLEKALSLHDTMVADAGCVVDDKFYAVLARGCLQMRQPLKALEVVRVAYQLPGHGMAASARRDGRVVGVEAKALEEIAAKLQAGGREEQEAWAKLSGELEKFVVCEAPLDTAMVPAVMLGAVGLSSAAAVVAATRPSAAGMMIMHGPCRAISSSCQVISLTSRMSPGSATLHTDACLVVAARARRARSPQRGCTEFG